MLSRPWARLVPDLAGAAVTGGGDLVAAALTDDGGTLIAYGSSPGAITVDLACLSGASAQGWWFDPATGQAQSLGTFPIPGSADFTPAGADDWVLVLDDAALGFGAPGQETTDTVPPAAPTNLRALPAP
jgi:hypothetical protein